MARGGVQCLCTSLASVKGKRATRRARRPGWPRDDALRCVAKRSACSGCLCPPSSLLPFSPRQRIQRTHVIAARSWMRCITSPADGCTRPCSRRDQHKRCKHTQHLLSTQHSTPRVFLSDTLPPPNQITTAHHQLTDSSFSRSFFAAHR